VKSFTKCRSDAAGRACHHGNGTTKLHGVMLGGHLSPGVVRIHGRRRCER
jgi:hypothetical protein